jgi:thiamine-monophosphate kinase
MGPMGEFDLIAALRERLASPQPPLLLGPGDDAAISAPDGVVATSVDAIVEGVHFQRGMTPAAAIGRKAVAAALSDLAAMGAAPGEAYIAIGVPPDLDEPACLELLAGAEAIAAETGTTLAGGDISRSQVLFLAVTVVGYADSEDDLVLRSGAQAEDLVVVSGELGGAAAGLRMIQGLEVEIDADTRSALLARQVEPHPRLGEGRALAAAGANAMIDLSDGLGADAGHVAKESGLRLEIELAQVPIQAGVAEVAEAAGVDTLELVAGGGEDYELLACLPQASVDQARSAIAGVDGSLTVIGRCVRGEGVRLSAPSGRELRVRGYDQLT